MNLLIKEITQSQLKERKPFKVGDEVRVDQIVREGDKERVQSFKGIVIAINGSGIAQTFTVRRLSFGKGIEKVFPMHSPNITDIVVEKESVVMRRSRLYYLRGIDGKRAMKVKEKRLVRK